MKKKYRFLSMILSLALVLALMPAMVFADDGEGEAPEKVPQSITLDPSSVVTNTQEALCYDENDRAFYTANVFSSPSYQGTVWKSAFPTGAKLTVRYTDGTSTVFTNKWVLETDGGTTTYGSYFMDANNDRAWVTLSTEVLNVGVNAIVVTLTDTNVSTVYKITLNDSVKKGTKGSVSGGTVSVTSVGKSEAAFTKAKAKAKSVVVPDTTKIQGKTFKITTVNANAFKGSKAKSVTLGKNITTLKAKAFNKSNVKTITIKSAKLKKASVKGSLKGSKVTTIKVKTGNKKKDKKLVKQYKKIFTKANAGKKVTVK